MIPVFLPSLCGIRTQPLLLLVCTSVGLCISVSYLPYGVWLGLTETGKGTKCGHSSTESSGLQ